uniref:Peptidase A1 domain-containing protein n=1 Tax=Oryza nivara TaxID=4536 RepID=A0A0E0GZ88_ORYNI
MDRPPAPAPAVALLLLVVVVAAAVMLAAVEGAGAEATGVFHVRRSLPAGGAGAAAEAYRAHDGSRRGRLLAAADIPLGGLGLPTDTGLYYTEIGIGTPTKRYYVQVDTGSDILWVNCISCDRCPRKSGLGLELTLYDPKDSSTGSKVSCDQGFCAATYGGLLPGCTTSLPCEYSVTYGDGSSTTGYFVSDLLQFDQVSGDGQTRPANSTVTFGCGSQQGGDLGSSNQALDGIIGFGQSNTSMLSQLSAAGKVKKIFAHCLDTINGGGIFAIGNVVQPKVKTTPLVPNMPHYNVNLKSIDVGGTALKLPSHMFDTGEKKGTIIDSGTTLTYLPEIVYKEIMLADNLYCVGFQNGGLQSKDGKGMVLLGDLVLSNKLVVYDLENQVIGWTEYNCSSSIKIKDEQTGATYTVDAHNISSGWRFHWQKHLAVLLVTMVYSYLIF